MASRSIVSHVLETTVGPAVAKLTFCYIVQEWAGVLNVRSLGARHGSLRLTAVHRRGRWGGSHRSTGVRCVSRDDLARPYTDVLPGSFEPLVLLVHHLLSRHLGGSAVRL